MEILNSLFDIKYWFAFFCLSFLCFICLIVKIKFAPYNSQFRLERVRNLWFFIFSIVLGGTLIGLGISMVLLPFSFIDFVGGFITVFGAQLITSTTVERSTI